MPYSMTLHPQTTLLTEKCRHKLYGRSTELQDLKNVLVPTKDIADGNGTLRISCVCGASGAGKSTLIEKAINDTCEDYGCVGEGRFVEHSAHSGSSETPFAALSASLVGFGHYLQRNPLKAEVVANTLDPDEKKALSRFCPALSLVLPFPDYVDTSDSESSMSFVPMGEMDGIDSVTGFARLKNTLRSFFQTLTRESVAVWVLDDLQWIDENSLSLLSSVLSDRRLLDNNPANCNGGSLVFIASYRTGELSQTVESLLKSTTLAATMSTHIKLDDLSLNTIQDLLGDLLERPSDVETLALAEIIHQRTHGRVFFVLQLVDYLQDMRLLHREASGWHINLGQIRVDAVLANPQQESLRDSLEIVQTRLTHLPAHAQHLLQVAALLGPIFEKRMLQVAIDATTSTGSTVDDEGGATISGMDYFDAAIQQHLFATTNEDGIYKFAHDKILEVSMEIMDAHKVSGLRWKVATALWKQWEQRSLRLSNDTNSFRAMTDKVLFICTDLFNASWRKQSDVAIVEAGAVGVKQLALLNKEVGRRCSRMNAYFPAIYYFRSAIDLLQESAAPSSDSAWVTYHDLMVRLHCYLAEGLLCCGRFDAIPDIAEKALVHATHKHEMFRIQYVCLQRQVMTNHVPELVSEALALLDSLGEHFEKNVAENVVNGRRIHIMEKLASMTDEEILNMPKLAKTSQKAALQVMANVLAAVQYFSSYRRLTRVLQLRMVEITLELGLSDFAPNCFGFGAFALFDEKNKKQFDASMRSSKLAIATARKIGGKNWLSLLSADSLTFRHFYQPYAGDLDDAMAMYQNDLKAGNLVAAFSAVAMYMYCYYFSGLNLVPLTADADTICQIKMEYGQSLRLLHMLPIYQLILNLTGQNSNILDMYNGKGMEYRARLGWGKTSRDGEEAQWSYSMHLYVYCEAWELAGEMYDKLIGKDIGFLRSFPMWHNRVFFFALIAIHRAREAPWLKRFKLKREAEKHVAMVELWVSKRKAINLVPKYHLLRAEMLTIRRNPPADHILANAYDRAIQTSMRSGYAQDAALAAACAARAIRDAHRREDYALLAQDCYENWGAHGVCRHLRSTSELHLKASVKNLQQKETIRLRSRQRFDASITKMHKEYSVRSSEPAAFEFSASFDDSVAIGSDKDGSDVDDKFSSGRF